MKTRLLLCCVVFGVLPVLKFTGAFSTALPDHLAGSGTITGHPTGNVANGNMPTVNIPQLAGCSMPGANSAALDSVTKLLRLKLYLDQNNYDDIVIGFNSGATPAYNYNYDSRYMAGIGAPEGLYSFSSDGVPLAINLIALPQKGAETVKLDVQASSSNSFILQRTELDQIPASYQIWLVDNYKKDSINLRTDSAYALTINKSDTASFGANRFKVVISQTPAPALQLVDFSATKSGSAANITWTTKNEGNNTLFTIERSIDEGNSFIDLDSLTSSSIGSYSYTDKDPPQATDQYKVKVANNGATSYTSVISLSYANTTDVIANNLNVYPNPTNGLINIAINKGYNSAAGTLATQSLITTELAPVPNSTAAEYSIKILNISGTVLKSATSSTGNWQDNVAKLAPGTYIITVVDNSSNKMVGRSTFVKL